MIKPPTPVEENRRLETLRNLKLLDTPPEERFDRVTRLAKKVFGTDIALVSLVDQDRQWFKSSQGLDATETPRDISFCGHAILDDRIMVVNDAREDERFCDNPLVTCDPNIRFYAGYPISAPDSSRIGTLCIIDQEPRQMSKEDLGLLTELGRMVEEELIASSMMRNDPATGLSNRLGFSLIAEHLIGFCRRNDTPASLLVFHFKNLKTIEENLGRTEGDRASMELVHLLLASFRDCDVMGRIAFDVFAVMLSGAKLDGLNSANDRFQNLLGQSNRESTCVHELEIVSQGAAYHPGRHADIEALLQDIESRLDDQGDSGETEAAIA